MTKKIKFLLAIAFFVAGTVLMVLVEV